MCVTQESLKNDSLADKERAIEWSWRETSGPKRNEQASYEANAEEGNKTKVATDFFFVRRCNGDRLSIFHLHDRVCVCVCVAVSVYTNLEIPQVLTICVMVCEWCSFVVQMLLPGYDQWPTITSRPLPHTERKKERKKENERAQYGSAFSMNGSWMEKRQRQPAKRRRWEAREEERDISGGNEGKRIGFFWSMYLVIWF